MRVAVVGAGFSGLIFSVKLLEAGVDVDLYEEHGVVGYPPHCTGLVSWNTLRLIGRPALRNVIGRYRRVVLSGGSASVSIVPRGGIYRVDRVALERELLERVESLGGRVFLGTRVFEVTPRGSIRSSRGRSRYEAVILAVGAVNPLTGRLGIGFRGRPKYGVNGEYDSGGLDLDQGTIRVEFNPATSHKLFSWIFETEDGVLAGTGVGRPLLLRRALRSLEASYMLEGRRRVYGGYVVTGPPGDRLWSGRVYSAGDSAGLNKPLTGGGLHPNALAAELAHRMILRGHSVNASLRKSLDEVRRILLAQYVLTSHMLEDYVLAASLIESASRSGGSRVLLGVDYDMHEEVALGGFRRAARAARIVAGAAFRRPRETLKAGLRVLKASGALISLLLNK